MAVPVVACANVPAVELASDTSSPPTTPASSAPPKLATSVPSYTLLDTTRFATVITFCVTTSTLVIEGAAL